MTRPMSPEAVRLFFGCTISFLLGGSAGVFGLRTLYGDLDRVEPAPRRNLVCPPPVPCPACVPAPVTEIERPPPGPPPDVTPGEASALPGLPIEAAELAREAVRAEVAPCLAGAPGDMPGVALIALTVTATGGEGFIVDASVSSATGDADRSRDCIQAAARRARFAWDGADGRTRLQLPLSYGH